MELMQKNGIPGFIWVWMAKDVPIICHVLPISTTLLNTHTTMNVESSSYKDLLKQREELDQKIDQARRSELNDAMTKVRQLIADFGLTPQDVFPSGRAGRPSATTGTKVAPKFRNPETGQTWTGRGKPPRWIQDQDREKFAI